MYKIILLFLLAGCCQLMQAQQSGIISGKIVDKQLNPVPLASVHVLNTNLAAVTDEQGNFSISGLGQGRYILQITAIGYATVNQLLNTRSQKTEPISIRLAEAARQLDAVLVTAQKKEESLQQVPLSVSAISARQVAEYRLWNTRQLSAIVPNLYSADPGDDRNITSIRGITSTSYDPAVATYIDGVNQFGLDTYIPQLLDIERIEVLRGPQGTLYGRNAMGGVINIITRQPTNTPAAFAEANVGNYGRQRYSAGIRTPLVKDRLFLGIAGMYDKRDGFFTNAFTNSSFDDQKSLTGNYHLKYLANARWVVIANLKHHNNRNDGSFPLAGDKNTAFEMPFRLNQNAPARMKDNTLNASLSVSHAGSKVNFSSQTAYQSNHRYYNAPLDGDFSPIDGVTIINDYGRQWNNIKVYTQEFRFTSPPSSASRLNWTAGAYFFLQESPVKQATHFGKDASLVGAPDSFFAVLNTTSGRNTGYAVYGQAAYPMTEKWEIIGGVRFDREHRKQSVLGQYLKDPDPQPLFDTRPDTTAHARFTAVSPKIGLVFHAGTDHTLYATYSRGYRPGGLTELSSDPSLPPLFAYKPEFSNNTELGSKNSFFDSRLQVNFAAFFINITDAQVPTLVLPEAFTVTRNAGKLTSRGVELELSARPAKGFQLDYNFGYNRSKYTSLKLSQNGLEADLAGKRQVFTPEQTSMLAVQYGFQPWSGRHFQLVARGEWMFLGRQYFDLANTIGQEGYHLLHARAGFTSRHFDLMFWARNLGDRTYIAYAYNFGAVHLGEPRTYGATLTARL